MEQFLFYFTHLGIPLIILITSFVKRPHSKFGLIAGSLFSISFLMFFYLWGQWPIVAVNKLKYLLAAIIFLQAVQLFRSRWSKMKLWPKGFFRNLMNSALLILGLIFTFLIVRAFQGRTYDDDAVSLEFPLKTGDYYISSGGSNAVLNNHFNRGSKSQRYALDVNLLGDSGSVSSGLGLGKNEDHYIFGQTVYAPCSGKIIELENQVADNVGGSMNVGPEQGQGNFIVIDCNNTVVSLVHLKQNSLVVGLGDQVEAGQKLAKVGNSGFSQEPHLHFQAAQWSQDSVLLGVPMKFNDQLFYRNQIIRR